MLRARRPDEPDTPAAPADSEAIAAYLEDASGTGPGRAAALFRPRTLAQAAELLRRSDREGTPVLFQAARSSLTAGAVPRGETLISVERLDRIDAPDTGGGTPSVRVGAGVRLSDLQRVLADRRLYYPPVPTYQEAMVGGVLATNAGGAASFKYGNTRRWVRGLELLLPNGDLLVLRRGDATARPGGHFDVALSNGESSRIPVPTYRLPDLPKLSAGYHAADPLDLVDLFVGSEGTLALIVAATLELVPLPASVVAGLVFLPDTSTALALAAELRAAALEARRVPGSPQPDVRAIEWIDGRGLALVRDAASSPSIAVAPPGDAGSALIFELELSEAIDAERAATILAGSGPRSPLSRLAEILEAHDAADATILALPGDESQRRSIAALREAVPLRVNELLAARRREGAPVAKVGGDLIVPFGRLPEAVASYEDAFRGAGLEYAIWGHLSDGNLHPNALARDTTEARCAEAVMAELADVAIRLGGAPLSEHGVGRSPLKQRLLRRFLGDAALEEMRSIKAALDPRGRLAPGVLLPARRHGA